MNKILNQINNWSYSDRSQRLLKVRTSKSAVAAMFLSLFISLPVATVVAPSASSATASTSGNLTCDTSGTDNISVVPSHGKAFYVDGTSTNAANDIDASYIGYRVTNSGTTLKNVWVKVDNFTSTTSSKTVATDPTIVPVAGSSDLLQIANANESMTSSSTKTAFFLLKATSINSWGNSSEATGTYSHRVTVYDGNPNLTGAVVLRTCTYSFTKIFNATAASANSVSSITLSKSQPLLGETVTVTVSGNTGTLGSGTKSPDLDSIWLTAAPYSSFPINALRLIRTSFIGTGGGCSSELVNQLLITGAANRTTGCDGTYTAKYTFLVIGGGSSTQIVAPIAEIASGTEIKHTSVTTRTIDLSKVTSSTMQVAKGILTPDGSTDSVTVGSTTYAFVQYIETVTVSGIGASGTIDYLVDSPTAGAVMETTTSRLKIAPTYQIGASGSTTTIIPTYSSGQYFFEGPFNFTNSNPLIIKYWMMLPISGTTVEYKNTAFAYIGSQKLTASTGISLATVSVTNTGGVTGTTSVEVSKPTVTTNSATSITDTTGTLNGKLNTLSDTTTLYFDWGTSPTLDTYSRVNMGETTTAGVDTSTTVTGLTPGTHYYFRIVGVGYTGLTDTGTILNFTAGLTLINTTPATSVRFTTATLNGNFTDIRSAGTRFRFYWSTDSARVSARTSESATVAISVATGSGVQTDTSTAITGLSEGTTYYFMFAAESSTSGDLYDYGDVLQFTTGSTTTSAASSVSQNSATINGSLDYADMDFSALDMKFIWGTSTNLTTDSFTVVASPSSLSYGSTISYDLTGLNAGTQYCFRAVSDSATVRSVGSILCFTTTSAAAPSTPPAAPSTPPVNITWPTPGPLTYPTPLGGGQLNAVATCNGQPVTGTYVYNPALGTILQPGTYTLLVTFVPNSGSACGAASTTVRIVVTAPTVTITWPNPAPQVGPYTLSPTQLNAVCSVPGTLTYDPALGTVLPVGTYQLKVTCTPTDPTLSPVTTTVPFQVVPQLARITWPTPTPRTGPVLLNSTILNATCSVPGTLRYTPALGTTLQPGTYVLSVTCVPTDSRIPSVTTTVTLVVEGPLKAPENATTGPITFTQGQIKWNPSVGATSYVVDIRGEQVCATTTTSCTVNRTIGPKTPVTVTALGKNNQKASTKAVYFNDKLLTAIEVNFATARFNIDAKAQAEINRVSAIIKREGFTYVEITGHTDPRGGALNVLLSQNRAKALASAMTKLVPGLTFKDAGLSYDEPKASNSTKAGMAKNRRSVGAVK